jgi:putative endopeptidase
MSGTTKAYAQDKLQAMKALIAYPDHWFPELFPTLEEITACGSFVEEYMKLASSNLAYTLALAGKNADEYRMEAYVARGNQISSLGASYNTKNNTLFISTTMLLPPVIPDGVTEARAYAAFAVAGHEMTHGFDLDGATYDKDGKEKNWWTVADKMAFESRMQQLVECYNHLEIAPDIMPGTYCNGTVTLEENIADLGGVNIALDAYTEYLQEQGFFGSVLQDQQRKFFESYADLWCCLYGKEYIDNRISGDKPDKHALPRERVNGVVMNIDLWYTLYGVNRNNVLYLPPERRTSIW